MNLIYFQEILLSGVKVHNFITNKKRVLETVFEWNP